MSFLEFLITAFYILIFYVYIQIRSKNLPTLTLKRYYVKGFWIKILASILFMLYYSYLTGGDTRSLYYTEGHNLYRLLLKDASNWKYIFMPGSEFDTNLVSNPANTGYFTYDGNFIIIKLTALAGLFTFGYYTPIGLFFAILAYSGMWRLFMFFSDQRPGLEKVFAYSILFFPSVVFWSAGILKDSICIGALGWLTFSLYNLFRLKNVLWNTIALAASVYLLFVIKMYILLAYAPILILYLFVKKIGHIKMPVLKYFIGAIMLISISFTFSRVYEGSGDHLEGYALEHLTTSIATTNEIFSSMAGREDAESTFNLGSEYDGTMAGLVKIAPYAIAASFYRPFIWETRKLSQLMAAVESLILAFFTLKILLRVGPFRFLKYIVSDPLILFSLSFALIFGLFVGTSTLNFGTLVRYKIPCMPFYTIALFLIYQKVKERKTLKRSESTSPQLVPAIAG